MNDKKPSKTASEARDCMQQAIHDELVKKARLGQDVIIERDGEPCRISAEEALRIQEEAPEYKTKNT